MVSDHFATLSYGGFRLRGTELLQRLDTSGVSWNTLPVRISATPPPFRRDLHVELCQETHALSEKKHFRQGRTEHTICKGKEKDINCKLD
jgi:hypothetical protein